MPAYEYEVRHAVTGESFGRITVRLPMKDRDQIAISRRTVPNSVTIGNAASPPLDQASEVIQGYRREEERVGNNREFRRKLGEFTPEQIKQAWNTPD